MTTRLSPKTPLADRLDAHHEVSETGCWLWTGALSAAGYGQLKYKGQTIYGHRAAYEVYVGAIPAGMQLDHICRIRRCINPAHLEIVTNRENTLRGDAGRLNAKRMLTKTHCPRGHEYTEANTYIHRKGWRTYRDCRTCARERMRAVQPTEETS